MISFLSLLLQYLLGTTPTSGDTVTLFNQSLLLQNLAVKLHSQQFPTKKAGKLSSIFSTSVLKTKYVNRKCEQKPTSLCKYCVWCCMWVTSAPLDHHTNINHNLPLLCMQFDSQWDTHPDNADQCGFIKPSMRRGDQPGGGELRAGAPSANSVTLDCGR